MRTYLVPVLLLIMIPLTSAYSFSLVNGGLPDEHYTVQYACDLESEFKLATSEYDAEQYKTTFLCILDYLTATVHKVVVYAEGVVRGSPVAFEEDDIQEFGSFINFDDPLSPWDYTFGLDVSSMCSIDYRIIEFSNLDAYRNSTEEVDTLQIQYEHMSPRWGNWSLSMCTTEHFDLSDSVVSGDLCNDSLVHLVDINRSYACGTCFGSSVYIGEWNITLLDNFTLYDHKNYIFMFDMYDLETYKNPCDGDEYFSIPGYTAAKVYSKYYYSDKEAENLHVFADWTFLKGDG